MAWLPAILYWLAVTVVAGYFGAWWLAGCWTLACSWLVLNEHRSRWADRVFWMLVVAVVVGLAQA